MGQMIKREGAGGVYRDHRVLYIFLGLLLTGVGIVFLADFVPRILDQGGMPFNSNGRPTFLPTTQALLFIIGMTTPFILIGLSFLLYLINNKIIISDEGIRAVNLWGKENFRARWDQITNISQDTSDDFPMSVLITSAGKLRLDNSHPCAGEILRQIRAHTGKSLSEPVAEQQARSREVRPERIFRYKFPWYSISSCVPFLMFGFFMVKPLMKAGALATGWPVPLIALGIPALIVVSAIVFTKNRKVVMEPERLTIIDVLGRESFYALWDDVTGLFFESSATSTNNGSRTRLLIYRVEAGARQGKISSSVYNFDECLIELKKRIPGDAILAVPGAKVL